MDITSIPRTPEFIRGVINLWGRCIRSAERRDRPGELGYRTDEQPHPAERRQRRRIRKRFGRTIQPVRGDEEYGGQLPVKQ